MVDPALQVILAILVRKMLPGVISRQVKFAGSARDTDAAADGGQPIILCQYMTDFSLHLCELGKTGMQIL